MKGGIAGIGVNLQNTRGNVEAAITIWLVDIRPVYNVINVICEKMELYKLIYC